ncbi:unnamed protein product [Paramecium octaurelia]|uniref:Uncharacterized protein n=1 Tax=Paramecium octaurelia TaxID=43137 RepID=A0A8S1TV06_PAROT|nr:unnamed protein product [Paramecium octaurelia]
MLQLLQPGQFNLHITDKNAVFSPRQNDHYHQPYALKLKNKAIQLDSTQYEKDVQIDSHVSQTNELSQNQLLKLKMYELENLSLKQQNELLSREIGHKHKEISKLIKICQYPHLPPVIKPKQYTFLDQEFQEYLPSTSGLYQNGQDSKRAQSYDYQNQQKNDSYSDSISYYHTNRSYRPSRIQSRNSREFQKYNEDPSQLQLPNLRVKSTPREQYQILHRTRRYQLNVSRLKVLFIFILAYTRWSKSYKQKRNLKLQQLKQLRSKYSKCLEKISNQDVLICKAIIKQWISNIIDPLIKSCSSIQFIQQSNENSKNPNSESSIQCRQNQLMQLTIQVMNNMEKFTEKDKIPELIQASLFLSLFKSQNIKAPLFVAKRTKYYAKNTLKIGVYQEKMIAGEYFIFRLFVSNLIESSNYMAYQNINHKMQCKFIILAIMGILQILYEDYFSELKQLDQPSTELFQRRIKISKSQDISIITDDNIDQEESLIFGLHGRKNFDNLMEKNQEWLLDICTKFAKILNNLHQIL